MAKTPSVPMPARQDARKEFLTEAELSEMIAIKRSTLRWWRYIGVGPAYVKFEGAVRYPIAAVREYIRSNMQIPALAAMEEKHAA